MEFLKEKSLTVYYINRDGKCCNTAVVDIKGIFKIIESIPSKNAEPIKKWFVKLDCERIYETFDSSLVVQRVIDTYRAKVYDEDWIIKRIKGIKDRKKHTEVWKDNDVDSNLEYAIITNDIYRYWSVRI